MTKPARTDPLDVLVALQQQVNQLADQLREQRARKAVKRGTRGKQIALSPGELPGPKPTALDMARAQRLLRRHLR